MPISNISVVHMPVLCIVKGDTINLLQPPACHSSDSPVEASVEIIEEFCRFINAGMLSQLY